MSPEELTARYDTLYRQQEILCDITWQCSSMWRDVTEPVRSDLMDYLNGSRCLTDKMVEWAGEFDAWWEALPEDNPRREDYYVEIEQFAERKFKALLAEVRLGE